MSAKLLTEHDLEFLGLKGGCTVSSESTHLKIVPLFGNHMLRLICKVCDFVIVYLHYHILR